MKAQNSTNDYKSLLVKYNTLKEAVHKAMGRTAACDKKQTNDQLIADVAYLKRLVSDRYNDYESLLVKYNALKEAVPPPDKLELLAKWFDFKYKDDENPEVQEDLRKWANNLRNALEDR